MSNPTYGLSRRLLSDEDAIRANAKLMTKESHYWWIVKRSIVLFGAYRREIDRLNGELATTRDSSGGRRRTA